VHAVCGCDVLRGCGLVTIVSCHASAHTTSQ